MSHNASTAQWAIQGQWDPREAAFAVLNQETGPDINSVFMTVAADLVLNQIAEPVRFVVETKVRIYPGQERFWYYTRRLVVRRWRLVVRRLDPIKLETFQTKKFGQFSDDEFITSISEFTVQVSAN